MCAVCAVWCTVLWANARAYHEGGSKGGGYEQHGFEKSEAAIKILEVPTRLIGDGDRLKKLPEPDQKRIDGAALC